MLTIEAIADQVKTETKIFPVGNRTKGALSNHLPDGVTTVEIKQLSGVVEYEPDEYTITAKAGTPIKELKDAVQKNKQYLPFDPLFVTDGATIGGTIAANSGGSGRYRYGGVRDFILGIYFIDGLTRAFSAPDLRKRLGTSCYSH